MIGACYYSVPQTISCSRLEVYNILSSLLKICYEKFNKSLIALDTVSVAGQKVVAISIYTRIPGLKLREANIVTRFNQEAIVTALNSIPLVARIRSSCQGRQLLSFHAWLS